jgi:hypothetical protein
MRPVETGGRPGRCGNFGRVRARRVLALAGRVLALPAKMGESGGAVAAIQQVQPQQVQR